MDASLANVPLNLGARRLGPVQRSGPLTVVPLVGEGVGDHFVAPLTGMKLSRVAGYGKVELECLSRGDGACIGIVPLHIGYIQDGAQNHALCRSGILASGQKRMFEDACCVQQTQGGYLEGREQWFFILPLALRDPALKLRGTVNYGKLWPDIAKLNTAFGKSERGHLDEIVCRERAWLTQYHSRFERLPDQVGVLVFAGDKLVGIELAPNAAYFAELWPALVSFCYGVEAMRRERDCPDVRTLPEPAFTAKTLASLRDEVATRRAETDALVARWLAAVPQKRLESVEEERLLDLTLFTTSNEHFSGQVVEQLGTTVYASIAATPAWLAT
jgi:hypothetical protein